MKMPSPTTTPVHHARSCHGEMAIANPAPKNAVTGTSLIGLSVMNRKIGLVASSSAEARPVSGERIAVPSRYVIQTSHAARSGTMTYGPQRPIANAPAAISTGRPGA